MAISPILSEASALIGVVVMAVLLPLIFGVLVNRMQARRAKDPDAMKELEAMRAARWKPPGGCPNCGHDLKHASNVMARYCPHCGVAL